MDKEDLIKFGMVGVRSAKKYKIEQSKNKVTELSVHNQVCKYLKAQYPNVMFLSDFAAGIKMSIGMASRQSMQKSNHAFPDIMVFEPRGRFHGLFLEVKRDSDALYNKDGSFKKSDHIEAQRYCITELYRKGYQAQFVCGFDAAKLVIDTYFTPPTQIK